MYGTSQTLWIIITAIILLVIALVLLTIFGGGIQPVVDYATQQNLCKQQGSLACTTTGSLPSNWNAKMNIRIGDKIVEKACSDADMAGTCTCEKNEQGIPVFSCT